MTCLAVSPVTLRGSVGLGLAACIFSAPIAHADEPLEPVVVSATRVPSRINQLVADVTVIEQAELQAAQGLTLTQLLARQPGVQMQSNGGAGKNSSVFLRGGESRHVLLLVDGVRYGSVTSGGPSWENIPLSSIERIEIVRGPMAALHGADAVAGVIQIFTRRPQGQGWVPAASTTVGSEQFLQASGSLTGGWGDTGMSLGLSAEQQKGFSATNPLVGTSYNPDRDGFRQRAFNAQLTHRIDRDWQIKANGLQSDGVSESDDGVVKARPDLNTREEKRTTVWGLGLSGRLTPDWRAEWRFSRSYDGYRVIEAAKPSSLSRFGSIQRQFSWENQVDVGLGKLLLALDHLDQATDLSTPYLLNHRDTNALVLGWSGEAGSHAWQVSARHEKSSVYGDQDTGNLGYGHEFAPGWRVGASIGSTFAAPTFNALYYPSSGNPNLQPEEGVNKEVYLSRQAEGSRWRLSAFRNDLRNLIQYDRGTSKFSQIGRARIEGVSLSGGQSWETTLGRVDADASADWLDAVDQVSGKYLARRANGIVKGELSLTQGPWRMGARADSADGTYDDAINSPAKRLSGGTVWGVSVRRQLDPSWVLALRVDNLSDRSYQTARGYNQPGRQVFVTLSFAGR